MKKKWSIVSAIFFLHLIIIPSSVLSFENNLLNPPARVVVTSSEGAFNKLDDAVTFQVLPSLNEILSGCKIKPIRTYSTYQLDSSS